MSGPIGETGSGRTGLPASQGGVSAGAVQPAAVSSAPDRTQSTVIGRIVTTPNCTMRAVTFRCAWLALIAACGAISFASAQENLAAPTAPRATARTVRIASPSLGNTEY